LGVEPGTRGLVGLAEVGGPLGAAIVGGAFCGAGALAASGSGRNALSGYWALVEMV
jgi:hypothetical protein